MNRKTTYAPAKGALFLLVAAAVPWPAAFAQNAPGAPADQSQAAASSTPAADNTLQEVVVTAERRATDVQTTPISIVAISGDQLQAQQMNTIASLQLHTPSLEVNTEGIYSYVNIRGIGNSALSPNITTGVAIFRDGLFEPETHGLSDPFYDLADTEVLRGPQGTFVGYSSTGGAVEINSANPNFRGVNGFIEGQLGSYTDTKMDGAINLPVSDTFAIRLAFNTEHMNSFYRDVGAIVTPGPSKPLNDPGQLDNRNFRVSLLWKPTDNFQALFKAEHNESQTDGTAEEPSQVPYTPGPAGCPAGVLVSKSGQCYGTYYPYSTHIPFVLNYNTTSGTALSTPYTDSRYSLDLRYTLPDGIVVRSLTGFQQSQYNEVDSGCYCSLDAGQSLQYTPDDDYYSEELNVISPSTGKLTWIAGGTVFYRDTSYEIGSTAVSNAAAPGGFTDQAPEYVNFGEDIIARIAGAFGQISYQFNNTLQFQVGLRGNWDSNDARTPGSPGGYGVVAFPPGTIPAGPCAPFNEPAGYTCVPIQQIIPGENTYSDSVPTGKVGLNWTPAAGQFFYAFYARGYKSGGTLSGEDFKPENVNDYELGWKGTMLDGHLQTALGGYWMNYQNMQQQIYAPATTGELLSAQAGILNLAPTTIKGIEASLNAHLGGLGVDFSMDYTKSELGAVSTIATYQEPAVYTGGAAPSNFPACASGTVTASCFPYWQYTASLSGESNPYSPDWQGNLALYYNFPIGDATLRPRVDYSYTSKQYGSLFQIPTNEMGVRHILDAYLTYDAGKWETEAYLTNFTNQIYLSGTGGVGGGVYYGAPRQYGVRLRRDF
jgi:iron complex outermembrane receptor protein